VLFETSKEKLAVAHELVDDLLAEARAELAAEGEANPAEDQPKLGQR
jgi:hypothetical protein